MRLSASLLFCIAVVLAIVSQQDGLAFTTTNLRLQKRYPSVASRSSDVIPSNPFSVCRSSTNPSLGPLYHRKKSSRDSEVSSTSSPYTRLLRRLPSRSSVIGVAVALSTAATVLTCYPGVSSAVDLSGAVSLVDDATSWLARVSETGFYQAFSLVFVSEIGDKTFFIAGLLAAKFTRLISFVGSMGALAVMTVLSVLIGQIFHAVPSGLTEGIPLDDVAAVLAFAFFGLKTLKEALDMEEGESAMDEEFAEAEEEVNTFQSQSGTWGAIASIFALVFAAEFGDRSFLSTIALSAAQNPFSVAAGGIAAHAVATGIAVSGGAYLAKYISERVIGIIGGSLFLVFAVTTAIGIF